MSLHPYISGSASEVLALILICNQHDPLFAESINDIMMKAKLKYDGLGELMKLSNEEVELWIKIRAIEEECMNDGSIGQMDRYKLQNERTLLLREDYRELQTQCRNIQRDIIDEIKEEAGLDDSDSK